jgi:hypothetical protein
LVDQEVPANPPPAEDDGDASGSVVKNSIHQDAYFVELDALEL